MLKRQLNNVLLMQLVNKSLKMEKERKRELNFKFWEIKNKEEALYIIKQFSYCFIFVGALFTILGFFVNLGAIIDGVIFLILGLLLFFLKSRIVAILLLLNSGAGIIITFMNIIGSSSGGTNIFLSIIILYISIATVYSTFKYHKFKK